MNSELECFLVPIQIVPKWQTKFEEEDFYFLILAVSPLLFDVISCHNKYPDLTVVHLAPEKIILEQRKPDFSHATY